MARLQIERSVVWIGDVDIPTFNSVVGGIDRFYREDPRKNINLFITSGGGCCAVGFSFYEMMLHIYAPVLTTIGLHDIGSMALIIFMTGSRRLLTPDTCIHFHKLGSPQKDGDRLVVSDFFQRGSELEKDQDLFVDMVVRRCGRRLSRRQLSQMIEQEDGLNAKDAVRFGLAHRIIHRATVK